MNKKVNKVSVVVLLIIILIAGFVVINKQEPIINVTVEPEQKEITVEYAKPAEEPVLLNVRVIEEKRSLTVEESSILINELLPEPEEAIEEETVIVDGIKGHYHEDGSFHADEVEETIVSEDILETGETLETEEIKEN